jgi:cold shock CspA family protein
MMTGRITRLVDHQQIGMIAADDGQEYGFNAAVLNQGTFRELSLGAMVSFEPSKGPKGLQARAVRLVKK